MEFHIDYPGGKTVVKTDFGEACALAVSLSAGTGKRVAIDCIAYSEQDAKDWSGEFGVERYREDPDASVFERIWISAESVGRIA